MNSLLKLLMFIFLAPFIGVALLLCVTTLNVLLLNLM